MIQNFRHTADENAHGGFQLLVATQNEVVEHWQRLDDDITDKAPVSGEVGKWVKVGGFGDGQMAHVWGLVQGSYSFALEAFVEDYCGELWHWQYMGQWERMK
jgi:hypothetical protein